MKELIPHVCCLCTAEEFEEVTKGTYAEIYIPLAEGGYLKHVKLVGGRHARIKVEKLPANTAIVADAITIEEELNFLPAGKIPYEYFEQIVEFFRQVSKKMKSEFEAHAWILWTKEKGYFISVPKQTVGKASVSFTYDDDSLPPGSIIVADWHSHNTMNAFYSGTDDNNDKSGIYYSGVIGKLTDASFEYVVRFNLYEQKKKCVLGELFDIQVKDVKVPADWLAQVELRTLTPPPPLLPGSRRRHHNPPFAQNSLWDQTETPGEPRPLLLANKGHGGNQNQKNGNTSIFVDNPDADYVAGPLDFSTPHPFDPDHYNDVFRQQGMPEEEDDLLGDLDDLEGYGILYGKEALESFNMIQDFLPNLEECDEPLLDLIAQLYSNLTTSGQMKIANEGIR